MIAAAQQKIDEQNISFWNELCGTQLAKSLGVEDSGPASLKKFDDWYFKIYPYLYKHIPFARLRGMNILEIGLGYGTVSQKLAEAGAYYQGLDIAGGPVNMVNHRIAQNNLAGQAQQGSVLDCPFADESFDYLVSIGCFHHTGNLQRALDEAWRVLKPGGEAMIMIYNAYSYRRWILSARATFNYFLWDKFGIGQPSDASAAERAQYDASTEGGAAAPETVFTSGAHVRRMSHKWKSCCVSRENIGEEILRGKISRETACRMLGPVLGLDLYCHLKK